MMNILVCKIKYPNAPADYLIPHQYFVGLCDRTQIALYSISTISRKEQEVYQTDQDAHSDSFLLRGNDQKICNLVKASFIDCTTSFKLTLTSGMDITRLNQRPMPQEIKERLMKKIDTVNQQNRNKREYPLSAEDFIALNPQVKKKTLKID